MRVRKVFAVAAVLALGALGACSDDGDDAVGEAGDDTAADASASTTEDPFGSPDATNPRLEGLIVVMAPGPLKAALDRAADEFMARYPNVTIELSYGHIPALLARYEEGADADLLVTPDEGSMDQAIAKGMIAGTPMVVARNAVTLVVPAGNPGGVDDATSLGDDSLLIAVCSPDLPCGRLAEHAATDAGVTLQADSLEPGGSPDVVTKASSGEIDLGVVFAVDAKAAGDAVEVLELGEGGPISAEVTAGVVVGSPDQTIAEAFTSFLMTSTGASIFEAAGFAPR